MSYNVILRRVLATIVAVKTAELFHVESRRDVTKLAVAFRIFRKSLKMEKKRIRCRGL